ncbi:MAG: NnrS family protein, partial [Oleiphilaceae bacterium]|nr:NnrS family protein [Oleiphilaceae bacterium]
MRAIPTTQPSQSASVGQLFAYPFRIFFLSMALLGMLAIPLWVLQVTGTLQLPLALPGLFWHQHELLFGFLSAAIAGFLLTAVCVWTKTERTQGFSP